MTICLRFSAVCRWRMFLASITSRTDGMAFEVVAASAIVSAADGDFFGIAGELFRLDTAFRDFFRLAVVEVATAADESTGFTFNIAVSGSTIPGESPFWLS